MASASNVPAKILTSSTAWTGLAMLGTVIGYAKSIGMEVPPMGFCFVAGCTVLAYGIKEVGAKNAAKAVTP